MLMVNKTKQKVDLIDTKQAIMILQCEAEMYGISWKMKANNFKSG
jgi:hypothetical protein